MALCIYILYGEKISTAKELDNIVSALSDMRYVIHNIRHNKYGNKRQEYIEKLSMLEATLRAREDELSKKFEEAADNMNILSEQYGIEIDLDKRCY